MIASVGFFIDGEFNGEYSNGCINMRLLVYFPNTTVYSLYFQYHHLVLTTTILLLSSKPYPMAILIGRCAYRIEFYFIFFMIGKFGIGFTWEVPLGNSLRCCRICCQYYLNLGLLLSNHTVFWCRIH
jgi:hypothetical protein